nr:MAG TPA: hypothetical protein [Bacteriophage sp.]
MLLMINLEILLFLLIVIMLDSLILLMSICIYLWELLEQIPICRNSIPSY